MQKNMKFRHIKILIKIYDMAFLSNLTCLSVTKFRSPEKWPTDFDLKFKTSKKLQDKQTAKESIQYIYAVISLFSLPPEML